MTYKLEDMFNDCAVIRTTFETLDLFSADDPIREEIGEVINNAHANMRRCTELCADVAKFTVLDRPLNIEKFSKIMRKLLVTGHPRCRLDSFMKVNVFQSIAAREAGEGEPELLYRYELLPPLTSSVVCAMMARALASAIFGDLRQSIESDANYTEKSAFDRNVFQKYVAIMFACYATTDPLFYN